MQMIKTETKSRLPHRYQYGRKMPKVCECGLTKDNLIHKRMHHCVSCMYENGGKHDIGTFEHPKEDKKNEK